MKKRLLFALGLCAVAIFVFLQTRPKPIEPPTQRPTEEALKKLFPKDSRQVFENADSMTLYAITDDMDAAPESPQKFRDFYVVSEAGMTDKKTRAALVSQVGEDVEIGEQARLRAQAQTSLKQIDSGFDPRYAIRAVKGKKKVDVLTDFSRGRIKTYYGDKGGKANTTAALKDFYDSVLQNPAFYSHHEKQERAASTQGALF